MAVSDYSSLRLFRAFRQKSQRLSQCTDECRAAV